MLLVFQSILPIFLLIGLGYAMGRQAMFSAEQVRGFARLVLQVALPALLFNALAHTHISVLARVDYLAVYGLGSLASFAIALAWFRPRTGLAAAAVRAIGVSCSNTAFIGLPIATQLFGAAATGPIALNMLFENLVLLPLCLILVEAGEAGAHSKLALARTIGLSLARNPMVLAIILGGLASASEFALPAPLGRAVAILAGASAPLALISIGAGLAGVSLHGRRGDVGLLALGKLVLHPALVLVALWLIPIDDPMLRAAVVLLAAMPMASIFPILAQRTRDMETCSAALLVATLASFLTVMALGLALGLGGSPVPG